VMNKRFAFLIVGLAAGLGALFSSHKFFSLKHELGASKRSQNQIDKAKPVKNAKQYGYSGEIGEISALSSWREPGFIQCYVIRNGVDVLIGDLTDDPITQQTIQVMYEESTTFNITCTATNGRDEFFFAGLSPGGEVVIERWRLRTKAGTRSFGGNGGPGPKVIKRTEIYRGPLSSPPVALEVDPEKRFLLLLAGVGSACTLYRMSYDGASVSVLKDSTSLPELPLMDTLNRFNHDSLGRIWELRGAGGASGTSIAILVDSDNDGVFEDPPVVGDYHSLSASGLYDLTQWQDINRSGY